MARADIPFAADGTISASYDAIAMFSHNDLWAWGPMKVDILHYAGSVSLVANYCNEELCRTIAIKHLGRLQEQVQAYIKANPVTTTPCVLTFLKMQLVTYLGKMVVFRSDDHNCEGILKGVRVIDLTNTHPTYICRISGETELEMHLTARSLREGSTIIYSRACFDPNTSLVYI